MPCTPARIPCSQGCQDYVTLREATLPARMLCTQGVVTDPIAAQDPPPSPTRKRPLIYVYDLEPLYSSKLLQYR
jgi:hypothetical protein